MPTGTPSRFGRGVRRTVVKLAATAAVAVVLVELGAIAYIRYRFMDSPWVSATLQVVLGGALVFAAGVLIGSS